MARGRGRLPFGLGNYRRGACSTFRRTVVRLRPGDTVWTPPGEEQWHGTGVDCSMSHIAMLEGSDDGDGTAWLEPVTDEQYASADDATQR